MDSLIPRYQKLAETASGNFQGLSILNHVKSIKTLLDATGSTTMLDFGCGRGDAYRSPHKLHHSLGLPRHAVTLYDPAFRPSSALPRGQFDMVVCSDVLEHVPEDEVDKFIERLFGYARKGVWASVCCRPAKKFFPDTETNLHACIKPFEWWDAKFDEMNSVTGIGYSLVETP